MRYTRAKMSKILIVEDELHISDLLRTHLEREGYQCCQAYNGVKALEDFWKLQPDLIILDLMLPGKNGLDVCKEIREYSPVYILMLTAKQDEMDRVLGLEMGADDYVIKPFSIRELSARVKVLLRRPHLIQEAPLDASAPLQIGELEIFPAKMAVKLRDVKVFLTALEFDLLYFLMKNASLVFNREQLLEKVWSDRNGIYDRTIDRLVSQLRKKIERDPANPQKIITVRGVGYKYEDA